MTTQTIQQLEAMRTELAAKMDKILAQPKYKSINYMQVLKLEDLTPNDKMILLHILDLQKRGIEQFTINSVCSELNLTPPAYAKTVRKLCDKGYCRASHKRGYYLLNKVF